MRISAIASCEVKTSPAGLPVLIEQRTCGLSAIAQLLLLVPALLVVIVPCTSLAVAALAEPATREVVGLHASSLLLGVAGLVLWAALLGLPAKRSLERLGARRRIEIDAGEVRVIDAGLFGARCWSHPLASFSGIAHHVRTSLSGTRNELVLVHPDPSRSLLLKFADTIGKTEIEETCRLLALPELPSRALYRRPRTPVSRPLPAAELLTLTAAPR